MSVGINGQLKVGLCPEFFVGVEFVGVEEEDAVLGEDADGALVFLMHDGKAGLIV